MIVKKIDILHFRIFLACNLLITVGSTIAAGQTRPNFAVQQKLYFSLMKVEQAWKVTRGGPGCKIGVIDSGFDFFHPALRANLKPGWFAPGFFHTDFFSMDAHGTEVASIIAARENPGHDGIWGEAPDCMLLTASMGFPMQRLLLL